SPEHFAALARHILPELARKREQLRLWSAGCATGEEAYSLAMVVHRHLLPAYPGIAVNIVGTDISSEAIAQARQGRYLLPSLHGMTEEYRHYVQEHFGEYAVVPEIRDLVDFFVHNLVDEESLRSVAPVDVLFCRNVLLYFTPEVRKRVVPGLVEVLQPGGYLFVGEVETLTGLTGALQLVHFPRALVYQKPDT
ncbi:MAG: protein-glutamate O-methyltransferase CheR, partial [Candidatus Kapabacteria bacterium]|nr:protein-glutamate O-methyltransferase CheR [Candidatus Kapabacteria bacterium]MDW7997667.1 protein-glutamate O-methyltransferase CheR [Bacteroidota bacterium]